MVDIFNILLNVNSHAGIQWGTLLFTLFTLFIAIALIAMVLYFLRRLNEIRSIEKRVKDLEAREEKRNQL
ncbi:hypothetical protein ACMGE6_08845 [Macrococcus equi]|uniref:hypothetical protein n=1 Tax=Macrococcus equi TaxID=3395462 RepID=UPI0039BE7650